LELKCIQNEKDKNEIKEEKSEDKYIRQKE
jgi:hypothetical protein